MRLDRIGRQPVDDGLDLDRVQGLDRRELAVGQEPGGRSVVTGSQQQLQGRAQLAAPPVLPGGPAQHGRRRGAERGEVVADRSGQIPPPVLAGRKGNPGRQRTAEVAFDSRRGVDH